MIKKYKSILLILLILMFGLAFLPILSGDFVESYNWQKFGSAYATYKVFLPIVQNIAIH